MSHRQQRIILYSLGYSVREVEGLLGFDPSPVQKHCPKPVGYRMGKTRVRQLHYGTRTNPASLSARNYGGRGMPLSDRVAAKTLTPLEELIEREEWEAVRP